MTRTRSPNFPVIDLKKAIELTKKLYEKAQRHEMPASAVVKDVWSQSPTSSLGKQSMGALKSFGLIDSEGEGEHRRIRVSDAAAKILENHPDKARLLSAAALHPRVHRTTWERCAKGGELPPDATLRHFLLFDYEPRFNESSIAGFIKELRSTIAFGEVGSTGIVATDGHEGDEEEEEEEQTHVKPGDFVQWASQGLDQFPVPRRVARVEGGFAFVDGSKGGVPLGELRVVPSPAGFTSVPLVVDPAQTRGQTTMNQNTLHLDEGTVILQYPARISPQSYEDLKDWLDLMARRVKRAVQKDGSEPDPEAA